MPPKPKLQRLNHTFVFKVAWDATALKLKVEARTFEEAEVKLNRMIKRMEGGSAMISTKFIDIRYHPLSEGVYG